MVTSIDTIKEYFPSLAGAQVSQMEALWDLYQEWNAKINVISRKDIDQLYLKHVLHSLSIAKYIRFVAGSEILDLGTGGGFPGIPMAIFFPDVKFHLIDGTAKKIRVVNEVVESLGLHNVKAEQIRAESLKKKYDFIITRAVAQMEQLRLWTQNKVKTKHSNPIPNGLIALKGGNLKEELKALPRGEFVEKVPISDFFKEDYFEEKYLIYLQL